MSQFGSSSFGFRPQQRKTIASNIGTFALDDSVAYSNPAGFVSATTLATVGAGTYTAAAILSGLILRDPAGASRTDTLCTAAQLVAAFNGCVSGSSVTFSVRNTADIDEVITIAVATGITAFAGTVLTINFDELSTYTLTITNADVGSEAAVLYLSGANNFVPTVTAVTQTVSITEPVVTNARAGLITTQAALDAAANATNSFVMTNRYIRAGSAILVSLNNYTGGAATSIPVVTVEGISANTCTIVIKNAGAVALDAVATIAYSIVQ